MVSTIGMSMYVANFLTKHCKYSDNPCILSKLQTIIHFQLMRAFLLILAIMILASCTPAKVSSTLKNVESYISERPDSALSVLQSIDNTDFRSKRIKAHHALLHAMALDKNYIDVTDDSLASVAVRYYQKHSPKKYLVRSLYYKGLSYFYDGQYDKSIIELSKAEPIAEVYDSLYLGFVKVLQSKIYNYQYNENDEVKSLETALDIFTKLRTEDNINKTKRLLAIAYTNQKKYNNAEKLFVELLTKNIAISNTYIKSMGDYAFLLGTRPDADYEASVYYYEKVAEVDEGRHLSKQDYWVWAHALAETGDFDRSQQIVDMLSPLDTSGTAYYWQYEIAKIKGDTSEALHLFERFSDKNNEEVVQRLRQSIATVQRDYYQSQYEISDYKLKLRGITLSVVIVLSVVIITIIVFSTARYRRKKEEEKVYYIGYAEEVNRQLEEFKCGAFSDLQKKYIALHKSKYETLQTLFEKYLQSDGRIDAEKLIYKKVVSLIDDLRNDIENTSKFDKYLDTELGGIMNLLRTEFPKLNKRYYKLFGYLALGFNTPIISHFMGCSENAVRIIKNRLKSIIKNSEVEHKSEFLEIIG